MLSNRLSLLRVHSSLPMRRLYATSEEFKTLNHAQYTPAHPVTFTDKLTIFDSTFSKERKFVPYEIKETTFKNVMGICGF